jgi:hypothetical protein
MGGVETFLTLFAVFGHVQVGIFFLYFPSTPNISRGKQSNPDKDNDKDNEKKSLIKVFFPGNDTQTQHSG